jgi:hypothetical protein
MDYSSLNNAIQMLTLGPLLTIIAIKSIILMIITI